MPKAAPDRKPRFRDAANKAAKACYFSRKWLAKNQAVSFSPSALRELSSHERRAKRRAEIIALPFVAAPFQQLAELPFGVDAFGQHCAAQIMSGCDGVPDHGMAGRPVIEAMGEGTV